MSKRNPKHDEIVRYNRQAQKRRNSKDRNNICVGVFIVFFGFVMGPPMMGLLLGVPLILVSFLPDRRTTPGTTRFVNRFCSRMDPLIDEMEKGLKWGTKQYEREE